MSHTIKQFIVYVTVHTEYVVVIESGIVISDDDNEDRSGTKK